MKTANCNEYIVNRIIQWNDIPPEVILLFAYNLLFEV